MNLKIYLSAVMLGLFLAGTVNGQDNFQKALKHLMDNNKNTGLKSSDITGAKLASEATNEKLGTHYLYINQYIQDIQVHNAVAVYVFDKNGNIVSSNHTFIKDAEASVSASRARITPESAIINAAEQLGVALKTAPVSVGRSESGVLQFEQNELTKYPISAQLKYIPAGDKLVLCWNLHLDMKGNSDNWDYFVDAVSGEFVYKYNMTLYCSFHNHAFSRSHDCTVAHQDITDGSDEYPAESLLSSAAARYRVYALPVESPAHGPRSLVTDDQYPKASPFGWHDTNGVPGHEFTTTQGNNAYAYQDKNNDNSPDLPDTQGGSTLTFDFPMDLNLDPRQNADATVTNLFYMTNMMHDISFLTGFTEQFGNFQQRNYTDAPGQGDPVLSEAFDAFEASPQGLNNANFSTPPDGVSGRMQMYLWNNNGGSVSVDSPEQIAGYIKPIGSAQFGRPIPQANETPITGNAIIAVDASNPNESLGCGNFANAAEMAGKVVLIDRGICQFSQKVYNAQRAGAIAVIICNVPGINGGNGDEMVGMAGGTNANLVTIPSVFVGKTNCDKIKFSLRNDIRVMITFQVRDREGAEYLDGSLDNGIIAHEYGHGISTRLTGGRTNSGCLSNNEQMGEGWSDFFSLVTTHRPGDTGEMSRGIGTYANAESPGGRGIRRFPYSTNMNINPQTYNDIRGTTAPHPLGEVWTGCLWDMYWAFVNLYGFDPNWNNENSGNFKAVQLVMEGMKLQPCSPGFVEGRDAILTADYIIHEGKHNCLIWEVFARRGIGFFADGGSPNDRNDGKEDFEPLPTCIKELKISKKVTALTTPGGEVDVELRAINHIPARQNKVTIIDELPDGLTYVLGSANIQDVKVEGNLLVFGLGDMEYEAQTTITYKLRTSASNKSVTLFRDDFEGDIDWDISVEVGQDNWLPSYDFYRSPETSFGVANLPFEMDASIYSPPLQVTGTNPALRFWHRFRTDAGVDGGFVQMSLNGGSYFNVPASRFLRNGPNSVIPYSTIAIPALQGYTGNTNGQWLDSYIDLSDYKGQTVQFRFRFASNNENAPTGDDAGWFIDDVEILDLYKYLTSACIFANDEEADKKCTQAAQILINSEGTVSTADTKPSWFEVELIPNPATDYVSVYISSAHSGTAALSLYSMDGRVPYQKQIRVDGNKSVHAIPLTGLPAGMYFVRVQSGTNFSIQKLIVK